MIYARRLRPVIQIVSLHLIEIKESHQNNAPDHDQFEGQRSFRREIEPARTLKRQGFPRV